jgi:hypothetical protein
MREYLCAVEKNARCDPDKEVWCNGDLICDASNTPGVCISPELAGRRTSLTSIELPGGRKVIGSLKTIQDLQGKYQPSARKDFFDGQGDNLVITDMLSLDDKTLTVMCETNARMAEICSRDSFWEQRLAFKYGETSKKPNQTWKQAYVARYRSDRKTQSQTPPPSMDMGEVQRLEEFLQNVNDPSKTEISELAGSIREVAVCLGMIPQ